MTWDPAWAAAAAAPFRTPTYLVQTIPAEGSGDVASLYSSAPWPYHTEAVLVDRCSVTWGEIQWPSVQASGASCTIALQARQVDLAGVRLGTIVQVSIALGGVVEPVFVGVLRGARTDTRSGVMTWDLGGLETSLGPRYVATGGDTRMLFGEVGTKGVISSAYTAGDVILSHTSLTLRAGSSGFRCLRVVPDAGESFYCVGTGDTGVTLTGVASGGALDTVPADASVSQEVVVCAFDAGHPVELLRLAVDPVVTTWPEEWRMGLPAAAVDSDDLAAERLRHTAIPPGYELAIQVITEHPVASLTEWAAPFLAPLGVVVIQRHGKLTARVVYDPAHLTGETVTDDDIVYAEVEHWPRFAPAEVLKVTDRADYPGVPLVAEDVTSVGPTAGDPWASLQYVHHILGMDPPSPPVRGDATTLTTAPIDPGHGQIVTGEHAIRIPAFGGTPGALGTSVWRRTWRNDVAERLRPYICGRPEIVTVTLPGWRSEAIGDGLALDLRRMVSRAPETDNLRGGMGLIIGGGPDFFGATTTYKVMIVPDGALS